MKIAATFTGSHLLENHQLENYNHRRFIVNTVTLKVCLAPGRTAYSISIKVDGLILFKLARLLPSKSLLHLFNYAKLDNITAVDEAVELWLRAQYANWIQCCMGIIESNVPE